MNNYKKKNIQYKGCVKKSGNWDQDIAYCPSGCYGQDGWGGGEGCIASLNCEKHPTWTNPKKIHKCGKNKPILFTKPDDSATSETSQLDEPRPSINKKYLPVINLTKSTCKSFTERVDINGKAKNIIIELQSNCPSGCAFLRTVKSQTNLSPYLIYPFNNLDTDNIGIDWKAQTSNIVAGASCMKKSYCDKPSVQIPSHYNGCTKAATSFADNNSSPHESPSDYIIDNCKTIPSGFFIKFKTLPKCEP
jgi:hypothetical protein